MQRTNGTNGCHRSDDRACGTCAQFDRSEWKELGPDDLALLSAAKTPRCFAAGQSLFIQGEPNSGLYCLNAGTVALRQLDEAGNSVLLGLAYAGDVIG
ncbi:MAG: cyclic nucleotide-binding domain-containing protein, partial [Alphaproteobacteria bacterium]|nr:cyclic nucleotide-binding domain-containing protein [Alphaproteobacteria bacterium]